MTNLPGSPPAERPELGAARGTVREGLGALWNLSQLLKSVRVGPRAIAELLPDVQASCGPLHDAFKRLLSEAAAVDPVLRDQLDVLALPRIRQLSETLASASKSPLRASRRIDLENKVVLALRDLGVARTLLDLVHESTGGGNVAVDAEELVRESGTLIDPSAPGVQRVTVAIEPPSRPILVLVNPRATMGLLSLSAGLAATVSTRPLGLQITADPNGNCAFRFSKQEEIGTLTVIAPVPLPAARATAAVIAHAVDARLEDRDGDLVVTVPLALGA